MRIVIDLQACQGDSRFRGIGRYSLSLAQAITRQALSRGHHVSLVLNERFPGTISTLRKAFDGIIPQENIFIFSVPGAVAEMEPANAWRTRAAELVREQFIASLNPDIVHVASLFESWLDDVVSQVHANVPTMQTAVTLYDLIPFVLSDLYLVDPVYREQYLRKLEALKRSDLLLAISEHSRKEAIELLGFASEKVVNITAAIEDTFQPQSYTAVAKNNLYKRYNISKPFVLYVPGGFDPRKNFDRLIEAFAQLPADLRENYQLVIASKLPDGVREDFTNKSLQAGLGAEELLLTGYVSDNDLIGLYNLCKLFVFPSLHEGFGLPALEAMACGAPVIGSNTTSIPGVLNREDALFDPLSVTSIANMLYKGLTDTDFEHSLRQHALLQAKKFSWENSARLAIDAFELLFESTRQKSSKNKPLPLSVEQCYTAMLTDLEANNLLPLPSDNDLKLLKYAIMINQIHTADKQLFVDISELINRDAKSGIQRVVRSILLQLLKQPPIGYRVEPVYSEKGDGFRYARRFTAGFMDKDDTVEYDTPISFTQGDVFIGLDLTADIFPAVNSSLKQMQDSGVKINYVIYDLIPLLHSWHGPAMEAAFTGWIASLSLFADNLICISAAVADDVKQWLMQHPAQRLNQPLVNHFHLGADINNSVPTTGFPENDSDILENLANNPSFLMVGTIEPRKGHAQTLAAFEELWATGSTVNLVFVGKAGWNVDPLLTQLKSHPELDKRLYWLEGISDEFLERVYQASTALLAVSEAEGFGLPLIEAAQHGLPIISRDIPVFNEVAGQCAYYFKGLEPSDLGDAINRWLALNAEHKAPQSKNMPWLTWEQSTQQLLEMIFLEVKSSVIDK